MVVVFVRLVGDVVFDDWFAVVVVLTIDILLTVLLMTILVVVFTTTGIALASATP